MPSKPDTRPSQERICTVAGNHYDDILKLKDVRRQERECWRRLANAGGGSTTLASDGEAIVDGAAVVDDAAGGDVVHGGAVLAVSMDLSPSEDAITGFSSFLASSSLPDSDLVKTEFLDLSELDVLRNSCFLSLSSQQLHKSPFDLTKAPASYTEAMAHPDAKVWQDAMEREKESLQEMGFFEEVELPCSKKIVGLIWVYAYKTDADGKVILGKEKARVVTQGFSQRPGQFDETYAPVAKMVSVWILLAWATVQNLEIFQFDCKTAFLHAKLRHPVYACHFPGYPSPRPNTVLRLLVALYSLRQSAYKFYMLFLSLLLDLGMIGVRLITEFFLADGQHLLIHLWKCHPVVCLWSSLSPSTLMMALL